MTADRPVLAIIPCWQSSSADSEKTWFGMQDKVRQDLAKYTLCGVLGRKRCSEKLWRWTSCLLAMDQRKNK